jgi:tetratricopeptide (TPR) repeat protein
VADKNKNKSAKAETQDSENLGPPVGAAAATAAQRSKPVTPVAVGSDAFVDRLLPHLRTIIIGAVVTGVVLGGFFTWRWMRERRAASDTRELAEALDILNRQVVAPEADKPTDDKAAEPAKSAKPTYATVQARAEAAVAALREAGSAESAAKVLEGNLLLQAGKLDDAEAAFRAASVGSSLDALLAREGLGYVAEARAATAKEPAERQKLLQAALAAFRAVQTDDKGPRRDHALYHEARILILLDQRAEARTALEKALVVAPKSDLEIDIQHRLAHLEATAAP